MTILFTLLLYRTLMLLYPSAPDAIDQLKKHLPGQWVCEHESIFMEQWWIKDDGSLVGHGVELSFSGDTLSTESLRILQKGDAIIYEATVPQQNNGEPVAFLLVHSNDSVFRFENAMHDFPSTIEYSFMNNSLMNIFLSEDTGLNVQGFNMPFKRQ